MITSPSKPNGILLTPGTASLRRSKSVTFGCERKETETRLLLNQEASDISITRSSHLQGIHPTESSSARQAKGSDAKNGSNLTAKLREARTAAELGCQSSESRVHEDSQDLQSLDWKLRYENYVKRTEKELKTIIAKQQAAKQYARHKDNEAQSLAAQLRQEHKKVLALEARVVELCERLNQVTTCAQAGSGRQSNSRAPRQAQSSPRKKGLAIAGEAGQITKHAAPQDEWHVTAGKRDVWTEILDSSPVRAHGGQDTHTRFEIGHRATNVSDPLRERSLNVQTRTLVADNSRQGKYDDTTFAATRERDDADLDLSLPQPSPPSILKPRGTELVIDVASPSPSRQYQAGKWSARKGRSAGLRNDAEPLEKIGEAGVLAKARQASARERLAARRRARQSMMTDRDGEKKL